MGTVVERTPHDIWTNVSQFLSRDLLLRLYDVNPSFLQIAILERWKAVKLAKCDKHTKWMLEIISNAEDGHGNLVREVTIQPWLVQPSLKLSHKRGGSLWSLICVLFDEKYAEREVNRRVQKRLKKDIRRVTDAISVLPNLTKYSLEWNDRRKYHPEMYRAFLNPVLRSPIGPHLLSLSLDVPAEMLRDLVPISLHSLENLEVHLCTKKESKEEIDYTFDSFAVFVNNLYLTLETISVSTRIPSKSLKLDRFFSDLGTFPRLRKFGLSIPSNVTHLSSPDAVVKFMNKHLQTLKSLRFCTNRSITSVSASSPPSKYWIFDVLAALDKPYPYLHDLHITLPPDNIGLTPLLEFLDFQPLDTLALTSRGLTHLEVQGILEALLADNPPIRKVHLQLQHLDPAFLELLATRLRKLGVLELVFSDIMATEDYRSRAGPSCHSKAVPRFRLFEDEFRSNPLPYSSWELGTLGLLHDTAYPCVRELFKLFADFIPAVQRHIDMTPEPRKRS